MKKLRNDINVARLTVLAFSLWLSEVDDLRDTSLALNYLVEFT